MKKILLAFALVSLLLLSGCTRALTGDINAQKAYCLSDKLKLKIEKDRCLHNVATLHFSDPQAESICAEIKAISIVQWMDDAVTKNIRNDCYYEVAVRRAGIGDASAVGICERIIGVTALNNPESGNMLLRDLCFYMVAVALQQESICEYIDEHSVKEYSEDINPDPAITEMVPVEKKFRDLCKEEILP